MRHGKKFNHLSRTASHRSAMLSNMASSLILHKRITTTVAKAKALRKYVEPLITRAKDDTTHSRRVAFSYLQNKESVTTLFGEVAEKVASRPGGYTRILKTGARLGDNAEMCIMELVDYNELMLKDAAPAKAKTRRSRRSKGSAEKAAPAVEATEAVVEEAKVEEAPAAEATEEVKAEAAPEAPEADTKEESADDSEKKEEKE
ncbi:MAG: 50S ribosomal protein L17 [Reichenbachiella sp.]|uniref:50S ribosomal protein L17 n=1 Tax=Reichenbachiella sp. TaxID=2184521 RepID=UPI003297F8C1